jgi:hypothetical protein
MKPPLIPVETSATGTATFPTGGWPIQAASLMTCHPITKNVLGGPTQAPRDRLELNRAYCACVGGARISEHAFGERGPVAINVGFAPDWSASAEEEIR